MTLDGVAVVPMQNTSQLSFTPTTALADGWHAVTAAVRDRAGNSGTLAATFGVDTVPPTAPTTTSITSGQTLSGSVPVSVDASDATSGIDRIDILVDGQLSATLTAPASCLANPAAVCTVAGTFATQGRAEGSHTLTLRAVDVAGNATAGAGVPVVIDNNPGSVSGSIYGPDGNLSTETVAVSMGGASATTNTGAYVLRDVPFGTYYLEASVGGQLRARELVTLSATDPSLTHDVTLCGLGTVRGTVTGAVPPGATVSLSYRVNDQLYGSLANVTTGASGSYSFDSIVPVGSFTVSARQGVNQANSVSGSLQKHGDVATVNLTLQQSAVTLPTVLYDGNALWWEVQANGGLGHGYMFAWGEGSPHLTLVAGGTSYAFTGIPGSSPVATTEQDQREIVIPQDGTLAGLEVTRKVFVPKDGYFVRYLEELHNPTDQAITVDVVEESNLNANQSADPNVIDSSAPDGGALTAEDRWVVVDDSDAQDIYKSDPSSAFAPLASVFAGAGGRGPDEASLTGKTLHYRWTNVTVPPGQTVAFMHLMSAEADRDRATAAAQRLVQGPPEAMAGLGSDETDALVNFRAPAVPLPLLPALDGKVTGRVFAGDGTTAIPSASVVFRSQSPYYGRPLATISENSINPVTGGTFSFSQWLAGADVRVLPRMGFDITVTAPSVAYQANASFTAPGDLTTGQQDIKLVFTGLGVVVAHTVDSQGNLITGESVPYTLQGAGGATTLWSGDGTMRFLLVPPGSYTLSVTYKATTVSESVEVPADSLHVEQNLVFAALGQITVAVTSSGTGYFVDVLTSVGTRATYCNMGGWGGTGSCVFPNLPAGDYEIVVYGGNPNVKVSQPVHLAGGAYVNVPITLPDLVTVSGTVRSRDGGPQPTSAAVYAFAPDSTLQYTNSVSANPATGVFTLSNVPTWPIRLRATQWIPESPGWVYYAADIPYSVTGNTVSADALLPWGALTTTVQRDLWQFTSSEAATRTIYLVRTPTSDNTLDPLLEVYDSSGALVASNDNISTSDHNARVQFAATAGVYTAVVRSAGSTTGAYRLGSGSNDEDSVFRPLDGSLVSGQVVDDTDAHSPIAGLTVRLVRTGLPAQTAVTDARGRYVLPLIPTTGDYTIEVVDAASIVIATANGNAPQDNLDIVVPAHGTVSVTVRRDTVPLAGVSVTFVSDHAGALPADGTRTATTNASGAATASLPYGHVTASVTQDAATQSSEGDLDSASLALPDIVFASSIATIQGRVANGDNVTPLPGATVTLFNGMAATTAADGTYSIAGISPGTYTVTASFVVPDVAQTVTGQQTITVAGGKVPLNFQLGVPVIVGKVSDPVSGPAGVAATVHGCDQGWAICTAVPTTLGTGENAIIPLFAGFMRSAMLFGGLAAASPQSTT